MEIDQKALKKVEAKYREKGYHGAHFIDKAKYERQLKFLKQKNDVKTEKMGELYSIYSRTKKYNDPKYRKDTLEYKHKLYKKTLNRYNDEARHSFGGSLSREDQKRRDEYRNDLMMKIKDTKSKLRKLKDQVNILKDQNDLTKTKNVVWIFVGILSMVTLLVVIYTIFNLPSLLSGLIDIPDF